MVRLAEVLEALPSAALWKKAVPTISGRLAPTLSKIRNRFKKIKAPGDRMVNRLQDPEFNALPLRP